VIKHAKALNAITNPGTNSYKRLVPGSRHRSISPIPRATARRRFAFPTCRIRRAGASKCASRSDRESVSRVLGDADGRARRRAEQDPPGRPDGQNLYDLEPEEAAKVPHPCASLDEALDHLDKDRAFLTKGGVFTDDMIDAYIALKMEEVTRFRMTTHPVEYDMYYSL
jgi:glutamine synthetase